MNSNNFHKLHITSKTKLSTLNDVSDNVQEKKEKRKYQKSVDKFQSTNGTTKLPNISQKDDPVFDSPKSRFENKKQSFYHHSNIKNLKDFKISKNNIQDKQTIKNHHKNAIIKEFKHRVTQFLIQQKYQNIKKQQQNDENYQIEEQNQPKNIFLNRNGQQNIIDEAQKLAIQTFTVEVYLHQGPDAPMVQKKILHKNLQEYIINQYDQQLSEEIDQEEKIQKISQIYEKILQVISKKKFKVKIPNDFIPQIIENDDPQEINEIHILEKLKNMNFFKKIEQNTFEQIFQEADIQIWFNPQSGQHSPINKKFLIDDLILDRDSPIISESEEISTPYQLQDEQKKQFISTNREKSKKNLQTNIIDTLLAADSIFDHYSMEKYKEFYIPTIPDKLTFKDPNQKKLFHKMFMWSVLLEEQIWKAEGQTFDQRDRERALAIAANDTHEGSDTDIPYDLRSPNSNFG